jgi:hypothetical protein
MRNRRRLVVATVLAVVVALIAGLILTSGQGRSPATRPAASTRVLSPFTGEQVTALREVLAVKIDNVVQARPQTGLGRADIVYVLPVEGGLTRLLAVFSAEPPAAVGPVRSAREADLELLAQFGHPAFAYSGAAPELLPFVAKARIVDLYSGKIPSGYVRDPGRPAPHNLYADVGRLLGSAASASKARDIGFRFGPAPAGGHTIREHRVSYPAASLGFTWSKDRNRWLVSMDGRPATSTDGGPLAVATVVVQHTTVATSQFLEAGARPPYARTVGAGDALVLRDGRAFDARWSRPSADGGTTFTTVSGHPMTFSPGPVWIVLVPQGVG